MAEVAALAGLDAVPAERDSHLPWYSRSVDATYLTGKRVFVFGDATHAIAAARVAAEELGFNVVGLGTYSREFARDVRAAAAARGLEALITDDYLDVEAAIAAAEPDLVLGTQMERHIAKRLGIPCAVISAPVHVQDFPARYSPQMGFEGANVLFDTWVHPLMMGLEEHLLAMFREDPEFGEGAAPSHLGHAAAAVRHRDDLAGGGGGGAEAEDADLRARQGPAQHRGIRPGARHRQHRRRNPVRREGPFMRADATPIRVAVVTMDSHLAHAAAEAQAVLRRDLPGLVLDVHAADEWGQDPAALAACTADIARGDIVVATMLFLDDHIRAVLPALIARRDTCDAMLCLPVRRRGGEADPAGPVQHGGRGVRRHGDAEAPARLQQARRQVQRQGPDEDAAAAAEAAALHSRHRAGRARVFPGAAILAGRVGGKPGRPGAAAGGPLRRRATRRAGRHRAAGAAGALPGGRAVSPGGRRLRHRGVEGLA